MTDGAGSEQAKSKGGHSITVGDITSLVSGIVGLAAFVYLLGGVVLALRLAFDHLPALGVVGQLPHDFLFSIGVTQVVFPALVLAALHGIVANALGKDQNWEPVAWHDAKKIRRLQTRHIAFATIAPVEAVLPGAAIALYLRGKDLRYLAGALAVIALVVAVATYADHLRYVHTCAAADLEALEAIEDEPDTAFRRSVLWFLAGLAVVGVLAGLGAWQTGDLSFLWLIAAWAIALVFVLGYLRARGAVRDIRRARDPVATGEDALLRGIPPQVYRSLATVLLTIPALVTALAPLSLNRATVCRVPAGAPPKAQAALVGRFVGETSDRVFIGARRRIVSIPQDEVARVLIGGPTRAGC